MINNWGSCNLLRVEIFLQKLHKKAVAHMPDADPNSHLDKESTVKTSVENYRDGHGTPCRK
ncbi:hypothetical protein ODZ84_06020 [Chryseobacterium fluminis]|uniref:hypothetical protein n=1 Tax=Chryseobacterium fluminis TaxID=2983606 RepID=UPI00225803A0|nr:hypothetical protein [Chryseobacterium sp. MMS21-Ot14]UZT99123.1 hypothetical protein ODZ84_06020 [Chryseobacterium sp. MMS21-Ot14]